MPAALLLLLSPPMAASPPFVADDAVLYRVEPIASSSTLEKFQGEVRLLLELYSDGNVRAATVLQSPDPELNPRVTSAVRLWRFRPGGPSPVMYRYNLPRPGEISEPVPLSRTEPQMTKKAREEKQQGVALYNVVVEPDGGLSHVRLKEWVPADPARPDDCGLVESGKQALALWRFSPAVRNGRPVAVHAAVEVNFRWK